MKGKRGKELHLVQGMQRVQQYKGKSGAGGKGIVLKK